MQADAVAFGGSGVKFKAVLFCFDPCLLSSILLIFVSFIGMPRLGLNLKWFDLS